MIRLIAALILMLQSLVVWADEVDTFRHYKNSSDSDIDKRSRELDPTAILELGHRGKKSDTERLKTIAEHRQPTAEDLKAAVGVDGSISKEREKSIYRKYERASRAAQMALAKLGDAKYTNEFVGALTSSGTEKDNAIKALGYIGDRKTAKQLVLLLSDDRVSEVSRSKHEVGTTFSYLAELALGEMFPEVLADFQKTHPGKKMFFKDEWKKWWEQNKEKYQ